MSSASMTGTANQYGTPTFRDRLAAREAALGLAGDSPAERVTRAERAMAHAYWNLEMAERRQQPWRVLDQMEARYFAALDAYTAALMGTSTAAWANPDPDTGADAGTSTAAADAAPAAAAASTSLWGGQA